MMKRLIPDAEVRRLWAPVLARLLLWAAMAGAVAGALLRSVLLAETAAYAAMASAIIYARHVR